MGKEIVNQVQEAQRGPYRINPRRNTPRHILIKLSKIKYKENRSEEHTSELQSHHDLVCRLLLEKKKGLKKYLKRL